MNYRTKLEFKQHWADLYQELADHPKDVEYFHKYLDHHESIARYKILGVRGSNGIVASSNAEVGHGSNEHAMPMQLISILAIEKQVLKLLEQENRCIQGDISEHQQLEPHRLSKQDEMEPDSGSS